MFLSTCRLLMNTFPFYKQIHPQSEVEPSQDLKKISIVSGDTSTTSNESQSERGTNCYSSRGAFVIDIQPTRNPSIHVTYPGKDMENTVCYFHVSCNLSPGLFRVQKCSCGCETSLLRRRYLGRQATAPWQSIASQSVRRYLGY